MKPILEGIEVLPPVRVIDHDLTVDHVSLLRERQLREVPREGPAAPRLQVGVAPVDECNRAEAVVFGLVRPLFADWERGRGRASCGSSGGFRGSAKVASD